MEEQHSVLYGAVMRSTTYNTFTVRIKTHKTFSGQRCPSNEGRITVSKHTPQPKSAPCADCGMRSKIEYATS